MPAKKIACLGGGSVYFHWGMTELIVHPELAGSELVLYDLDGEKVRLVAGMAKRLVREAGTRVRVRHTTDLADAVDGADFAISSIGGSGAEITRNVYASRFHDADLRIPAKYGIPQIVGDTCGPAGLMMGLRAIPAYLRICREMEKRCPNVILFNHSNPMAVLMRAMHKYTSINAVGICHGVQEGIRRTAELLSVPSEELDCRWVGTNHCYWLTRVLHNGQDVYETLREKVRRNPTPRTVLAASMSEALGWVVLYPSDDHIIEFFPFLTQLGGGLGDMPAELAKALKEHGALAPRPATLPTARATAEERREFFKMYRALVDRVKLPPKRRRLKKHVGGEEVGGMMAAIATGKRIVCIANIANKGTIPNLPPEAEVEVEAVTDRSGVRALQMGECPTVLKAILEKRFVWQELVADAAATGDRRLALQALMIDEMAIWPDKARAMLDELLLASRELLPEFFPKKRGR